jgi:hypothetical protein
LREGLGLVVLENMAARRILGPKKYEVTGEWGKLRNEELNDLYSSSNLIRLLKSKMLWARHVAHMWERRRHTSFWRGNLRERDNLEDPGVDDWIILRWVFRKWDVRAWTGLIWLWIGTGGGHL